MALDRLEIEYQLVGWSEIDKNAIIGHNAVYPQYADRNYGDIAKIVWDEVPDFDLFTYSFPCQDIAKDGYRKGFEEGSGTRSSLIWQCKKAILKKRPRVLIMENVKAIAQKKNLQILEQWKMLLSNLGYSNFAMIMDSKDYGIPQHRERYIMVSILDCKTPFKFPDPIPLTTTVYDFLENAEGTFFMKKANNSVYEGVNLRVINTDTDGCCRTIKAQYCFNGIANLLSDGSYSATGVVEKGRLRKLTTRECFRLMGVSNEDTEKLMSTGLSKTWLYKMAGNSIVVDVLVHVFKKIYGV